MTITEIPVYGMEFESICTRYKESNGTVVYVNLAVFVYMTVLVRVEAMGVYLHREFIFSFPSQMAHEI